MSKIDVNYNRKELKHAISDHIQKLDAPEKRTGVEYVRIILYYLSKATERVSYEDLQTALLRQAAQEKSR